MPRPLKFIPPAMFLITLFFSATAAAASSDAVRYGEGISMISGWTISNVQYRYSGQGNLLTAVEFDLDQPAGSVQVSLSQDQAVFFRCTQIGGNHWFCQTGAGLPVPEMHSLRILAFGMQD